MRRIQPVPGHAIAEQDDSGLTSVLVCRCGQSFIGIGPNRMQEVRWEHASHAYDRSLYGEGHGFRTVPDPDDYQAPGGGIRRSRKREESFYKVIELHRSGAETFTEIARQVGVYKDTVKAWLIEAGELDAA